MAAVGLLYVGAVLVINGLMLLGRMNAQAAAPLNYFVGGLQVLTPTVLIIQADGDSSIIFGASGLYLFGFTYLWLAINSTAGWDGAGLGWFSLFVAVAALGYSWHAFTVENDPAFGVIWLLWAVLWFLFFLLLALDLGSLGPAIGVVALVDGVLTGAVPAFLMLSGRWHTGAVAAVTIAVIGFATLFSAFLVGRRFTAPTASTTTPAAPAATS
jgi:putative amide transporter protein